AINLAKVEVDDAVVKLIPSEVAQKYLIMPVSRTGATLTIAMVDPTNVFAMDDIKFMTGYNVEPVVASEIAIKEAIDQYYGSSHAIELKKVMDEMAETEAENLEVLEEQEDVDLQRLEAASEDAPVVKLVNIIMTDSIKKNASDIHLEPYEKDFRVRFRIDGVLYEIMHPPMKLKDAITSRIKIMAKLDISEKRLPQDGRIKVQMKEQIGLNFAAALRSFLRQDPNIILVGEIRDFETAEIAVKAALTGHLVLSTLHTNDAPSTINRLMNMGIEPFLVSTSVNLICAQRLV